MNTKRPTEVVAPVLVTGVTGNVGRHVVERLKQLRVPFAAAGADLARLRDLLGPDVALRRLDLTAPETYAAAVEGMRAVFLLRPPAIANVRETLNVFVDRAIDAGVEHVTFLSVEGADSQRWVPHHAVEEHLTRSMVSSTLLRPGFFAQNLGDAYRDDIRDRGEIYVPAGQGRVAFVDVRDVAELAARTFVAPDLRGKAWTLTGPEAVTFEEVAQTLSAVLGRPIRYRAASVPGYAAHLRKAGLPWMQVLVQSVLHVGLRFGNAARVDPALGRLIARAPRTIREYVVDHRAVWERSS